MPQLDRGKGIFAPPLYKLGSQNTPYKLGLKYINSKESNDSQVLQEHQTSTKYSFIFIHFVTSENDKNVRFRFSQGMR